MPQNLQFCQHLSQAYYGASRPVTLFPYAISVRALFPSDQFSSYLLGRWEKQRDTGDIEREREIFYIMQGFSFYLLHSLYFFLSFSLPKRQVWQMTTLEWEPIFKTADREHLRSVLLLVSWRSRLLHLHNKREKIPFSPKLRNQVFHKLCSTAS